MLVVTISVGTVSVKQQLHNYAIYNLCGLSRGNCVRISVVASVFCAMLAFVISHAGILITFLLGMLTDVTFKVSFYSVGACAAVILLYIGVAVLIPNFIIRGKTIKTLLITHRE